MLLLGKYTADIREFVERMELQLPLITTGVTKVAKTQDFLKMQKANRIQRVLHCIFRAAVM